MGTVLTEERSAKVTSAVYVYFSGRVFVTRGVAPF